MPIQAEHPFIQTVPPLPQPNEVGLPRLRITHPPQPIAQRIRIEQHGAAQQPQQLGFTSQRSQIFEAPPASLEHMGSSLWQVAGDVIEAWMMPIKFLGCFHGALMVLGLVSGVGQDRSVTLNIGRSSNASPRLSTGASIWFSVGRTSFLECVGSVQYGLTGRGESYFLV